MKYLKYILIVFILFLTPKVHAATYNVSSHIEAIPNFGGGTYGGYAKGLALPTYYNVNTRYDGQLAIVEFYLNADDWDWGYNKTYTVTLNMATSDWRNNFMGPQVYNAQSNGTTSGSNLYVSNTFRFISYKQIKFNIKTGTTMAPYLKFRLYSTNTNTTAITGVSNWQLSSITISSVSATPTPAPVVTPTPTPTPQPNNQDIINNQTQNTENIINNQNENTNSIIDNNTQNTTDIINNNNSNTDRMIDEIKNGSIVCGYKYKEIFKYQDMPNEGWLGSTGAINSSSSFRYSDYVPIFGDNVYSVTGWSYGTSTYYNLNVYDEHKNFLFNFNYATSTDLDLTAYTGLLYIRINVNINIDNNVMIVQNDGICVPSSYAQMNGMSEVTDYLKDDSDPNISDNEFLSMFNSIGVSDPLSYLLTLPTQLINKIVSLSGSCSPVNLGSLYGTMITLPCINLENILGSTIWTTIDVIFSVSLLVVILKNLYDTFSNLLTMGAEKEAKEKFSMPTPMDFLSMILGGDR